MPHRVSENLRKTAEQFTQLFRCFSTHVSGIEDRGRKIRRMELKMSEEGEGRGIETIIMPLCISLLFIPCREVRSEAGFATS
jgi:hypothetical protein